MAAAEWNRHNAVLQAVLNLLEAAKVAWNEAQAALTPTPLPSTAAKCVQIEAKQATGPRPIEITPQSTPTATTVATKARRNRVATE